jgi:CBS domain-containing protein
MEHPTIPPTPRPEAPEARAGEVAGDRLSDRFLGAFARVEDGLKRILGTASKDGFRWMVRQAAKRNAIVAAVEEDLTELADLRNAIVHERGGGYVIAEPHAATVERLERIAELILDPPGVELVMSRPVVVCAPDEPIRQAARRMVRGDFSRLPVYAEGELVGLLTANALARWVAARLTEPEPAMHEETVRDVLGFGESARRFELVAADQRVADVLALFSAATQKGRRIEAVLVTATGSPSERPLGIITIQDLPRMYGLLEP